VRKVPRVRSISRRDGSDVAADHGLFKEDPTAGDRRERGDGSRQGQLRDRLRPRRQPKVENLDKQAQEARAKAKADAEAALKAAASSVEQARQADAATYNAAGLKQSEAKLAEAKKSMSDPCKYLDAKKLAEDAARQANNAREAALAEKRRIEEERRRAEEERRRKEEEARRAEEDRLKMFPPTYVVQKGDYLWRISGMQRIYENPVFWPIIHDANSGKIADPDLIYPGQELTIPRDLSDQQMSDKLYRLWAAY